MKPNFLTLLTLGLLSLACSIQVPNSQPFIPTQAKTSIPTPSPNALVSSPTPEWTAEVSQVKVNVRSEPDGDVVGYLQSGDQVMLLKCVDNWCQIKEPAGWVYRGCLSDNPKKLKCEAKP